MPSNYFRWMPIRRSDEILAEAVIMKGNIRSREQELAWARAQGLNLIVNYFHIKLIRMVGGALLSATPQDIMLSDVKEGWAYRKKPWIKEGNVIDIVNNCLFVSSTSKPTEYRVTTLKDLKSRNCYFQQDYDDSMDHYLPRFVSWRDGLDDRVKRLRDPHRTYQDHLIHVIPRIHRRKRSEGG